ncbi:MAG: peptidoglycan-binding protein LysM [Ideonella sp.]
MGIVSFFKEAGQKLFGPKEADGPGDAADKQARVTSANEKAGKAIEAYIASQKLDAAGLKVEFDGTTSTVTVSGQAEDMATKERIVLCCGNVRGVHAVNDLMTVAQSTQASRFYTVVSGDTLSGIAKGQYGKANAYMKIFEANKPMLSDPDKIYPGQLLRIPA